MKKYLYLLFIAICALTITIGFAKSTEMEVAADLKTAYVVDNNGDTVYYRNSSEPVLRLAEYNYPTQSLRAVWVSHFVGSMPNYTTEEKWKSDYCALLDNLEDIGFNCIVFHVRTHNNALYNSKLNPKASFISACDFDEFDPLEYCIEETHRRGMEFHAWLNPYRVKSSSSTFCAEDYPEGNPARDSSNLLSSDGTIILNPGIPENRQFIIDSCMELIENYDVDAINFDDYFYIDADDSATQKKYNTTGMSSDDWHREQVNLFIKGLSEEIRAYNKTNKKAVQLGIAPSGTYRNGGYVATPTYNANGDLTAPLYSDTASSQHYGGHLFADTLKWITNEWIDYMMPQAYWAIEHTAASYASLSRWWSWAVHYKKVNLYMGMGIYMAASTTGSGAYWQKNSNEIRDQILNAGTHEEIGGFCMYSYNYINSSNATIKKGIDLLKNDYLTTKIPCDVKKSYAGTLATPDISLVKITGNKLTFKGCDNVRGYMVFEVAHGKTLNTSDINQVYHYGTETEITLDDPINNDYYVCTVNLANELSTPLNVSKMNNNGEYVKSLIDLLPDVITTSDEESLARISESYTALDKTEQAKVTNYQSYLNAVTLLNQKKNVIVSLDNYVDLNLYTPDTKQKIKQLINEYKNKVDGAKSKGDIDNLEDEFESKVGNYQIASEELKEPISKGLKDIEEYYNKIELKYYTQANQDKLSLILSTAKTSIQSAQSQTSINNAVKDAKSKMDKVENSKELYDTALNDLLKELKVYLDYELEYNTLAENYSQKINEAALKIENDLKSIEVFELINSKDKLMDSIQTDFESAIDKIEDYADAADRANVKINRFKDDIEGVSSLKAEYIEKIAKAETKEEVETLVDEAVGKYKKLQEEAEKKVDPTPTDPVEDKQSSCKSNSVFVMQLIGIVSLICLIFRKKH